MRLEQLKCLVDIAQTGSISSTAQRLYVTQQAVSKSIKQLEQELGIEVLIRTNMGVCLTPIGQKVLEFAKRVLDDEAKLRQEIQESKTAETEDKMLYLQISSTSSVTNLVLPTVISRLNAHQMQAQVNLISMPSFDAVMEHVCNGTSDIGLMTINGQELKRKLAERQDMLEVALLVQDDMVAVMDRRSYSGEKTAITGEEFALSPARTIYNIIPVEEMQDMVYQQGIICSNDADFHRSMMEKAGAITLMSGLAYQYYFNSKKYVALNFEGYSPDLVHVAIYRKQAGEHIRRFVSMIRKEMYIK